MNVHFSLLLLLLLLIFFSFFFYGPSSHFRAMAFSIFFLKTYFLAADFQFRIWSKTMASLQNPFPIAFPHFSASGTQISETALICWKFFILHPFIFLTKWVSK